MLKVNTITKTFKTKTVLKNINISISEGTSIAILGNNGAGKTTLIKIMLGLLIPTKGFISYEEQNIEKIKNKYLNLIGAVLEGNRNIYSYLSAWENLKYFGRLSGMSEIQIKKRGNKLLKLFDLIEVADNKVDTFSRGMQQKVAIIIALLNNPKILFLDEPTLGLDVVTKNKLIKCLLEVKNNGTTIILTTHQLEIVDKIADEIFFLKKGELITSKNKRIISTLNESLIKISLKNRCDLNIVNGNYVNELILYLLSNGEKIEFINKRNKTLEEVFLEIYKEEK